MKKAIMKHHEVPVCLQPKSPTMPGMPFYPMNFQMIVKHSTGGERGLEEN